ncbi:LysR family transcriptional regulator [Lactiplantibacillus xiangfangensis]|uniref:HTH lysR-type domain-containing protein n=1 Tax=Lactiplantibacillus xiangfangensis TaxID=942150 RepID=A0A0R2MD55_9LACO|nr:hypothetical protein IV64_GL002275 [Lactiplantibacillus xiangfangensis]
MLDNYLLQELVTFAATGTLAKTAEQLNVTQPTVTRGLQKLETDLGVQLFDRQPNRISLTATGQLAAKKAATLLQANHDLVTTIRDFDKTQRVLKLATTIPGPLLLLAPYANSAHVNVASQLLSTNEIGPALKRHHYSVIFSNQSINTDHISSKLIGVEKLSVHLNKFMYQANQEKITFAELKDLSFIVMNNKAEVLGARLFKKQFRTPTSSIKDNVTHFLKSPVFRTFPFSVQTSPHWTPLIKRL